MATLPEGFEVETQNQGLTLPQGFEIEESQVPSLLEAPLAVAGGLAGTIGGGLKGTFQA